METSTEWRCLTRASWLVAVEPDEEVDGFAVSASKFGILCFYERYFLRIGVDGKFLQGENTHSTDYAIVKNLDISEHFIQVCNVQVKEVMLKKIQILYCNIF